MGYTVTRPGGTSDAGFEAYARLLRQQGKDLGKLARVPEPGTNRRWLHVWPTEQAARQFADELRCRTDDGTWQVQEVQGPSSEGPLGPLFIQLAQRADGLLMALHPLSKALIRSAFPGASQAVTQAFIGTQEWDEYRRSAGALEHLVRQLAPSLTGLSLEQLDSVGYAVLDDDTEQTLVFVAPSSVAQWGGTSVAGVA